MNKNNLKLNLKLINGQIQGCQLNRNKRVKERFRVEETGFRQKKISKKKKNEKFNKFCWLKITANKKRQSKQRTFKKLS